MTIHAQHESRDFVVEIRVTTKNTKAHSFAQDREWFREHFAQLARQEAVKLQAAFDERPLEEGAAK